MADRSYRVYLANRFTIGVLWEMILVTFMVFFVQDVKLDPLQLVLMGTTLEAAILLFEVPTGVVADLVSRRLSVIIGTVLMGLAFIAMGLWRSFGLILLAQALWGLGYTFTSGATQAWISDEIGEERSAVAFMRGAQVELVGAFIGLMLGVVIGSASLNLPFLVGGAGYVLLACALLIWMPETGFKPIPRSDRKPYHQMVDTFKGGIAVLRRRPVFISILLVGLFLGVYSEGYDRLWTAFMLGKFTLPGLPVLEGLSNLPVVGWMGILKLGAILVGVVATEFARRVINRSGNKRLTQLLSISSLVLVISLAGFSLSNSFLLTIACFWGISAARQLIDPLYTTWVNQRIDSGVRATVLSLSSQVDAVGQIMGGPGVGWVARQFGLQAGLLTSTGLLMPILVLLGLQKAETQPRGELAEQKSSS